MAAFPTRFTVQTSAYTSGVKDAHGNPVPVWGDPVPQRVYGWHAPAGNEPKLAGHDRTVVNLVLLVPETFTVGPRDRVTVLGKGFEVIGYPEDLNHGPFNWRPGLVVNLKRVEG